MNIKSRIVTSFLLLIVSFINPLNVENLVGTSDNIVKKIVLLFFPPQDDASSLFITVATALYFSFLFDKSS